MDILDAAISTINQIDNEKDKYRAVNALLEESALNLQNVIMKETLLSEVGGTPNVLDTLLTAIDVYWSPAIIKYIHSVTEKEYHTPIIKFYDAMGSAIIQEDRDMVNYLINHAIQIPDQKQLPAAVYAHQMDIIQWIVKNRGFMGQCPDATLEAVVSNNLPALEYLYELGCGIEPRLLYPAINNNYENMVKFMEEIGVPYNKAAIFITARKGNLEKLAHLTNPNQCPHLIDEVVEADNLGLIQALYEKGYLYTKRALFKAVDTNDPEIFEFLYYTLSRQEATDFMEENAESLARKIVERCNYKIFRLIMTDSHTGPIMRDILPNIRYRFGRNDIRHYRKMLEALNYTMYPHITYANSLLQGAFDDDNLPLVELILNDETLSVRIKKDVMSGLLRKALNLGRFYYIPYLYEPGSMHQDDTIHMLLLSSYYVPIPTSLQNERLTIDIDDLKWLKHKDHVLQYPTAVNNPVYDASYRDKRALPALWDGRQFMEVLYKSPEWSKLPLQILENFIQWMLDHGYEGAFDFLDRSPSEGLSYIIGAVGFKTKNIHILRWLGRHEPDMDLSVYIEEFGDKMYSLELMRFVCRSIYDMDPNYDFSYLEEKVSPKNGYHAHVAVIYEYLKRRAYIR